MLNAELFRQTARVIDEIDEQIKDLNASKSDTYQELKARVTPVELAALKEAIKLRRKRRVDKDACERHDETVWNILNVLEAVEQPKTSQTVSTAAAAQANGIVEEMAPTRVHEEPSHDPETGEIIETSSASHDEADAGEVHGAGTFGVPAAPCDASANLTGDDPGDPPACLDRRKAA